MQVPARTHRHLASLHTSQIEDAYRFFHVSCSNTTAGAVATWLFAYVVLAMQIDVHKGALTPHNALSLISQYDTVLDCTDNAPTRYLISDACVVSQKPLVSGAAIGTDGQLTVYNHGEDGTVTLACIT